MSKINPLIALKAGNIGIDITPGLNALRGAIQGDANEVFNQLRTEDQRRVKNNAIDSFRLSLVMDEAPEDKKIEVALQFVEQNKQRNTKAGLDSDETLGMEALLRVGKLDELNRMLNSNIKLGRTLGLFN